LGGEANGGNEKGVEVGKGQRWRMNERGGKRKTGGGNIIGADSTGATGNFAPVHIAVLHIAVIHTDSKITVRYSRNAFR